MYLNPLLLEQEVLEALSWRISTLKILLKHSNDSPVIDVND